MMRGMGQATRALEGENRSYDGFRVGEKDRGTAGRLSLMLTVAHDREAEENPREEANAVGTLCGGASVKT